MLLSDLLFLQHCRDTGNPFPISISGLRKDRLDGRYGIPHTRLGSLCFYDPELVNAWLNGQPVVQPQRHPALTAVKPGRRGKPTKAESAEAQRRGITVPELRARTKQEARVQS